MVLCLRLLWGGALLVQRPCGSVLGVLDGEAEGGEVVADLVACLLNEMSSQAVSNTKARINSRLFDENGGDTVVLNIKSKLFRDV